MNYIIPILVISGLFWLANKWIGYLRATRGTEGFAKRRIFSYLFMAFITLVGITTVLANALFELIGLDKPAQFEWMALAAFAILAYAAIRIAESGQKKEPPNPPDAPTITQTNDEGDNVTGDKSGDTVAGDKISGDKVEGDKTGGDKVEGDMLSGDTPIKAEKVHIGDVINNSSKKKVDRELTTLHPVNPDDIIGRGDDIEELHTLLFNNKVVVNGLGGIGKTTLAEAYIFKYYEQYEHIAWITNNQSLKDDFAQNTDLIKNLNIETGGMNANEIYREILRQLRNFEKPRNLLVIDNTDASIENVLHELPGQPNWHLLVTSRETIADMKEKKLGFLSPKNAAKLFKKYCQRITDEGEIADIVEVVDYHTLSIEILAKTAQRRGTEVKKLKAALKNDLKANIKTTHSSLERIDNITTYLCSIFELSSLSKEEIQLMKQFTCLPAEFHTFERLNSLLFPEEEKEDLAEMLTELKEKGWLLCNVETDSYKMHRIIAEVIAQKQVVEVEDVTYLLDQLTQLLHTDQAKDNPIDKFKWIPFGHALLDRFPDNTLNTIALLQNNLATVLQDLGAFDEAKELLEKVVLSNEKNFGIDHPSTAVSYSNLALVLKDLGAYDEAKELLEKAVLSDEKNFGVDHPSTAVSYSNLALVLKDLGAYDEAKGLLQKAVASDEKNFGINHPTTAVSYSNLALVLKDLGEYGDALRLLRKALKIFEKTLPEGHPNIERVKQNLEIVEGKAKKGSE